MTRCCHNCDERFVGCHTACRRYLAEAEENAIRREAINRENDIAGSIVESIYQCRKSKHNTFKNLCNSVREVSL
jgi:hypothetical protein